MDRLVAEAHKKIQNYQWTAASDLCEQALGLLDPLDNAEVAASITEFQAKCEFKAAFQSKKKKDFASSMGLSVASYERAATLHAKVGRDAHAKRAGAKGLFASFWLEHDTEAKTQILEKCIAMSNEAAMTLEGIGDKKSLAETRKELQNYLTEALLLAREWRVLNERFEKALEVGRNAIVEFSELGDDESLLETLYVTLWLLAVQAETVLGPRGFRELAQETERLWKQIEQTSRKIGAPHSLCLANAVAGDIAFDLEGDSAKALGLYESAVSMAENTGDSYLVGRMLASVLSAAAWSYLKEDNLERRRDLLEKGTAFASSAVKNLEISSHTTSLLDVYDRYANCYIGLASSVETQVARKKEHLFKAIEIASIGTRYENGTLGWRGAAHSLSKAMYFLAAIENDPGEKRRLLREAMPIREETLRVTEVLLPDSWDLGVMCNYLALIKAELAKVEQDPDIRLKLLEGAVSDMDRCRGQCKEWVSMHGFLPQIARYCEWHGDILSQLYAVTFRNDVAIEAAKTYHDSIRYLSELEQSEHVAPIRWKIGKIYDLIGDYKGASDGFRKAAEDYRLGAKKIAGLKPTFEELAIYMDAWAEIESARLQHAEEEYDLAYRSYANAAERLQETQSWNYLSTQVHARSLLERGEALSREEKPTAAIQLFGKALESFQEAKVQLESKLKTATDPRGKEEVENWLNVAKQRESYTFGRIELEEARSLDRRGEKDASSRKYKSAAVAFRTLATKILAAQDRAEMETFAQFCESWAGMKEAESKAAPELFAEAAESFLKARENATNPSLRFLALGNASICHALESGTKFRQSRNAQHYSDAKRHLEIAADQYNEAGFKKTGTWTRATQRLFDALMLLADAEVERTTGKKAELYHTAEKHLVLAAKLYGEAGFPRRKRETLEQLERTREEKEVLLAPLEALAEIPTALGTRFPSIILKGAQPPGLERFEEAHVTGELRTAQRELTIGSDFTIGVDIANVGKTPATLIKMESMVPEGCESVENEGLPKLDGNSLDLRGKRLEYLKTHEVKLSLTAIRKGAFELSPRVVYVDDRGNYKSTSLQPLHLTIREPGISEGLHAPPTVHLPQDFQFENERSREVFSRLVKEFLDDYMTKRIVMERAGWRSLMDVIRDVKIPRSALYGPGGRTGPVLAELERRGLVETRVFPKERGRGGEIKKVRVAYENTIVRRIVDRAVMENA